MLKEIELRIMTKNIGAKKCNCWEIKKCGKTDDLPCPAHRETKLHGVHGGINAGRACWVVAGTLCGGEEQGTFAKKHRDCEKCDFYGHVRREEGMHYESPVMLLARLKRAEIDSY